VLRTRLAPTRGAIAGQLRELVGSAVFLTTLVAAATLSGVLSSGPAQADQVGSLKSQAKVISQELIQEQLQIGGYQQQYSVASERVAADARSIAQTQLQIGNDKRQVKSKVHLVRHLAISSYVFGGSESSTSNAGVFSNNESTVQAEGEYATITIGNLTEALAQLHTAQHTLQSHQAALQQQQAQDRSEQNAQANDLAQANRTEQQMESAQAQVTGQLATAVAQEAAAQAAAATAAVAAAQRAAVPPPASSQPTSSASPAPSQAAATPPTTPATTPATAPATATDGATTDPALNPFLQCVVQAESGGNYGAVSPDGLYMGAFQFSQSTWNFAAQEAGLQGLVNVPPNTASKADQDTVAVALYALDGQQPWLGDRCSQ
jgi:peptidoglycan hydrolase CwlO-like protein